MKDFTLKNYSDLLQALLQNGYDFITFEDFCNGIRPEKFVILRHDVDLKAPNSLEIAKIENMFGVRASYYFRVIPQSDQPQIIMAIAALGHEIGYHYEDMSLFTGDPRQAILHFEKKLDYFRTYYPVKTICMHGSPTSRYDNRDIWKTYDYHDFGIIGEPYFDVDFNEVFYLTDTGRCWDGHQYSVRDRVDTLFSQSYHQTKDIVKGLNNHEVPDKIMITTHPQRWTDNTLEWLMEWGMQSVKNVIKRYILAKRK